MSQQQPSAGRQLGDSQLDSRHKPQPPQQQPEQEQEQRMQPLSMLRQQDPSTAARPQQEQRMQSPFLVAQDHSSAGQPDMLTAHLLEALQRCHIQHRSQEHPSPPLQQVRKPQQQPQQPSQQHPGLLTRAPDPLLPALHPSHAAAVASTPGASSLEQAGATAADFDRSLLQRWGSFTAAEADTIAQLLQDELGTDDLGMLLESCLEEAADRARSQSVQTSSAVASGLLLLGDRGGSLSSSCCSFGGPAATDSGGVTIDWDAMLRSELSVAGLGSMDSVQQAVQAAQQTQADEFDSDAAECDSGADESLKGTGLAGEESACPDSSRLGAAALCALQGQGNST